MPKRRNRGNRDLPDNLYFTTRPDGRRYYYFQHPLTRKKYKIEPDPYDREDAIRQVMETNSLLSPQQGGLRRALGQSITLREFLATYRDEILPKRRHKGQPLSEAYLAETHRILARIDDGLGDLELRDIRQSDIAGYLAGFESADAHNQHRVRLIQVWRHALSRELVTDNLPERVLPRDLSQRLRQRLTLKQYRAIYAEARPAIQNAMELSLNSLQRRADIRKWRFEDQREGFAYIVQSKTKKHGPSAWLRVTLELPVAHSETGDRTLGDLINRCRDGVLCPFLVHERPLRIRKAAGKDHPFQLTLRSISQGFADARDATGLFEDMAPAERPTFHELISLGQHLREKQGWSLEQIQRLRGHTSAGMTKQYQEGHEWTTIESGGIFP